MASCISSIAIIAEVGIDLQICWFYGRQMQFETRKNDAKKKNSIDMCATATKSKHFGWEIFDNFDSAVGATTTNVQMGMYFVVVYRIFVIKHRPIVFDRLPDLMQWSLINHWKNVCLECDRRLTNGLNRHPIPLSLSLSLSMYISSLFFLVLLCLQCICAGWNFLFT